MTAPASLAAVPWPDAAGRARPNVRSAAPRLRPRLTFLLGVFTVLVFSSTWVMFITGPDGNTTVGALVIALYTPGYLTALVLLGGGGRDSLRALLASPPLWLLMAIVTASVLWSVDPALTGRRVPALLLTTLAGVALAARFDWAELSEVIGTAFAVIIVGSFLLAILVPSWGRMTTLFPGAWRGLWNEKNALGGAMAKGFCLLAAAAALNPRRRWMWAGFAVAALLLIQLSWSKTALVTALFGGAMVGFVAMVRRGGAAAVAATFLMVTVFAGLAFLVAFDRGQLIALLGKDATLTGRTRIWEGAMVEIHKSPMLGYGYQAVWSDADRWAPLAWITKIAKFKAEHAHNSWIETWLGLGYVGLAAWTLVMGETWLRTMRMVYGGRGAWLALPFLAVYTLQSLTESAAYLYNDVTWVIFTAILVRAAAPPRGAYVEGAAGAEVGVAGPP